MKKIIIAAAIAAPPSALPEHGELERSAAIFWDMVKKPDSWYRSDFMAAYDLVITAAQARIAELELDFKQSKENAETNANLLNESLTKIVTLEAENAQLRADKAELYDALSALILGTPIDSLNRDDDGLKYHRSMRFEGCPRNIDAKIERAISAIEKHKEDA